MEKKIPHRVPIRCSLLSNFADSCHTLSPSENAKARTEFRVNAGLITSSHSLPVEEGVFKQINKQINKQNPLFPVPEFKRNKQTTTLETFLMNQSETGLKKHPRAFPKIFSASCAILNLAKPEFPRFLSLFVTLTPHSCACCVCVCVKLCLLFPLSFLPATLPPPDLWPPRLWDLCGQSLHYGQCRQCVRLSPLLIPGPPPFHHHFSPPIIVFQPFSHRK